MPRAEYVLDVPYPRSFVHQSSPPMLRLVAALNGQRPSSPAASDTGFTYCDLGCGTADTLLTFAAANPRGRFHGVDFNPQQIATARVRAQKAELGNVELLECDFTALLEQDLPPLDFLVAHGIWTWVSAEKRAAILAFARRRLKSGGLFYVSYDALPAWAALEPLRRLMLEHTRHLEGSTLERARAGYELMKRLADGEAGYFRAHPTARSMLSLMEKAGLPYVAHEYFHEHWEPMYVADVARSLGRSGLSYVGQVPLHLNLPELAFPPKLKEHARTLADRLDLEMLKDYALNEPFRADVYIHGDAPGLAEVRSAFFADTTFALVTPLPLVKREVPLTPYTLDLTGAVYDGILEQLERAPSSAATLAARTELATLGVTRIADALQNLALGEQVMPACAAQSRSRRSRCRSTASSWRTRSRELEPPSWRCRRWGTVSPSPRSTRYVCTFGHPSRSSAERAGCARLRTAALFP
jgi:ubiquinone/menaquinone biosynthesis C-methylase UbiE